MFIKTNDNIFNLIPSEWIQIYLEKRPNVNMDDIWSIEIETRTETFIFCDCDTREEAAQTIDKLWDALRKNESSYDMTKRGGQNEV